MCLRAFIFLFCVSLSVNASAALPEWIWTSDQPAEREVGYFRKTFEISKPVKSAELMLAVDNVGRAWLNGKETFENRSWEHPIAEKVTDKLKQGENMLSIRTENQGGPAGLLCRLTVTFEDGSKLEVVSDKSFLVNRTPEDKIWQAEFDPKGWVAASSFGKLGVQPWGGVNIADAGKGPQATSAELIEVPSGFEVERLYSVPKNPQGSWVSMTADTKGRLVVSDQNGGLYRITPGGDEESTKVVALDAKIGDAQGLLFAFDSLYVSVNGSAAQGSGLYRLKDTNGDDQFDEVKLLTKFAGGGEHGPHAVRLGPDGMLYVIAGNHTKIPEPMSENSPVKNWAEDLLLKRNPDGNGHATGIMAPAGWIARTDKDGSKWELVSAGFRNPYDMDFNQDGELFCYDADMEWDTGAPWYRPTRVNHAVDGGEFGWRYGTGKWPEYFVDSLGSVVDIGLGSPTGIEFGTGAKFPAKYQRALFINDWTYGKIYAVHMQPTGASYKATFEPFVVGKPLPVTDVVINPKDGNLYFTIGGRGTQSGLYRVKYVGDEPTAAAGPMEDPAAAKAREMRKMLEAYQTKQDAEAVAAIWPYLNSTDRVLRFTARVALENQPLEAWKEKALAETKLNGQIQAMVALARSNEKELLQPVATKLLALPWQRMSEEQSLDALRALDLTFIRLGKPDADLQKAAVAKLSPMFPHPSELVSRELCRVLIYLEDGTVVPKAMAKLKEARTQQDQMFYAFVLRTMTKGWTHDLREAYFGWLSIAEHDYRGGNSFGRFVNQIRADAVATLDVKEQAALKDAIAGKAAVDVVDLKTTRQFVHNWQLADFADVVAEATSGRSFEKGKAAYEAAQCAKCHRFSGRGGDTGPDITGVGNRFDAKYVLESLVEPSKVVSDQYQNYLFSTADGEIIIGRVIEENDDVVRLRTDPFAPKLVELAKKDIDGQKKSAVSEMPSGLINVLNREEILDLVAYLRSGGNPDDKAFQSE